MQQAVLPKLVPTVSVSPDRTVILLLSALAREDMVLAQIVKAQADKVRFVLGTLNSVSGVEPPSFDQMLAVNQSVRNLMHDVVVKDMMLLMRYENVLKFAKNQVHPLDDWLEIEQK